MFIVGVFQFPGMTFELKVMVRERPFDFYTRGGFSEKIIRTRLCKKYSQDRSQEERKPGPVLKSQHLNDNLFYFVLYA